MRKLAMRRVGMLIGVLALSLGAAGTAAQLGREGAAAPPAATPAAAQPIDQGAPDPAPTSPAGAEPVRPTDTAVRTWALEAAYAVFYFLAATVMVVAGVGLAIPVLGGFALLLSVAVAALGRRFKGRAA